MRQSSKNRLSALSGFPVKDAMVGLATGNREGKPAERKQEILTPPQIVEVCTKLWGKIALDPCWCKGAITDPVHEYGPKSGFPFVDGLRTPWMPKTFINPPYKDLKEWLEYGMTQPTEQIWLVPVRTHRKWWRSWRDCWLDAYCELDPLAFLNYSQVFPAPLLLGYVGQHSSAFIRATESLGSVYPASQHLSYK